MGLRGKDKDVLFYEDRWYFKDSSVVDRPINTTHVNGLVAYLFHDCGNHLGWIIHPHQVCDVCKTKPPSNILTLWMLYNLEAGVSFNAP